MSKVLPEYADLQLLNITDVHFVRSGIRRVALTALSLCAGLAAVNFLFVSLSFLVSFSLVILGSVLSWTIPTSKVAQRARQKRTDMDVAVAVYLDLVNVLLAGGCGIETAMLSAASAGDGWGFEQIRLSLARAQSSRSSYWDSLRELGEQVGITSLLEVANSVQLAGEHGARVRQSLTAKAQALRARNLARVEHEAEERTERMGIPVVLMFIGFILLIGYPAFVGTVSAL